MSLFSLCKRLSKPFKINVINSSSKILSLKKEFRISPEQTPFEVLEEKARELGVLLIGNGEGDLVIVDPGKESAVVDLIEGENFKEIDQDYNISGVYSDYQFLSQSQSDDDSSLSANEIEGKARDRITKRFRPLVQTSPTDAGEGDAQMMAQWDATVRRARSNKITVTVATWYQDKKQIWKPNLKVKLVAPSISVDATMLIDECQYVVTSDGSFTVLTLVNKDAYAPKPVIDKDEETW